MAITVPNTHKEGELEYGSQLVIERPKTSMEHLILFLLIFGFIFMFACFWAIESILWNRVVYSTGSQWQNTQPIYLSTPLEELQSKLIANYIGLVFGVILMVIAFALLSYRIILKKNWNDKSKNPLIVLIICSGVVSILGFWLKGSILTIVTFPSIRDGQSGSEWINDIASFSNSIALFGMIIGILFFVIFVICSILLFLYREKEEVVIKEDFSLKKFFLGIIQNIPFYIILLLYLFFTLIPVYLALKVSISTVSDLSAEINPSDPFFALIQNYSSVLFTVSLDEPAFSSAFMNSIIIGIGTGILGLSVSLTAAYALARIDFGGNKFITSIILATQMFPGLILLIPQYVIWTNLGLLERDVVVFGLLLASASGATAYCTWMMKGYFETIPIDIEEAAYIDGAGRFATFVKIAIPLAKAGIVAVLVFTFITSWQEFVLARTFIGETDPRATLPLLFYNYQNTAAPDAPVFYELLAPYAVIVALPIVIFFMLLQKQLAAGAVAGGVK
ncbi:MAG: carbohydrate ABC transporter permease [Promethearchaeota archaeon]